MINLKKIALSKVVIVAEAGVNHNGKISNALKLVDLASKAKADYVKFQTFVPELLTSDDTKLAEYQKKNISENSHLKMLKKLAISEQGFRKIINRCNKKKIKFMSSPFDIKSVDLLKKLNVKIIKVPSGEITNIPYLRKIGSLKKKIILSTGMSNIKEIKKAINILTKSGTVKKKISILHCNTEYPATIDKLNLLSIKYMKNNLKMNIGYSDHSEGYEASLMAISLGAKIIEKHFTLNKNLKGPDHKASLSPKELITFVKKIRLFEKSLGKYQKKPYKQEVQISKVVRKKILANKDILKNQKFSFINLTTKRSNKGLDASNWDKLIGKKAKKNFKKDQVITI